MSSLVTATTAPANPPRAACLQPVPFTKAHYGEFKAYAARGRERQLKDWSEDEPCAAARGRGRPAAGAGGVDYCSIKSTLDSSGR